MPDALLRQCLDVFGCDFYLAFGQTEMSPVTTFFQPEHQLSHSGAVGTQVVNVQIGIMADDGELLPRGKEGEIVYRGPHALNGYLYDEKATANAFTGGWFHSGDVGRLDPDGMLWFTDLATLVFDALLIIALVATFRRLRTAWRDPLLWSMLALTAMIAGPMAYSVSNWGTLFRLREMVFAALVLVCIAAAPRKDEALPAPSNRSVME